MYAKRYFIMLEVVATMYYKKEMSPFMEAKEKYNVLREFERKKIINFLLGKGLKVPQTGGMGYCCYTNGGTLERSYDLTNWKWITVKKEEVEYLISLQAFDQDKSSKNFHVLMDRIGICCYPKEEKKPDYFNLMKVTSLELTLDEKDLEELYKLLQ